MKAASLDSSAWIEIAHHGANAAAFLRVLTDPASIIVSTIALYEVWKYSSVHGDENRANQLFEFMQQCIVVPPESHLAIQAARLSIRHKLAMADSLIYATALAHNAILWTQDDDFKTLPHVRHFPKARSV
ncbi:MAG: type II toxin-antitoxin system VapC family toxin [Verrucomicrobia bacterium]|nr:MAG: type II toxin-antitoxin system VapC family toxin [Verrucomicrobiota bacterium]